MNRRVLKTISIGLPEKLNKYRTSAVIIARTIFTRYFVDRDVVSAAAI